MKNLLILRYIDVNRWEWGWAMNQFRENRQELAAERNRPLGFAAMPEPAQNGHG